jgi:predicted transcriptional regulator
MTKALNPKVRRGRRMVISVMLDPEQVEALDRIAMVDGMSRSVLARKAIRLFLAENMSETSSRVTSDGEAA